METYKCTRAFSEYLYTSYSSYSSNSSFQDDSNKYPLRFESDIPSTNYNSLCAQRNLIAFTRFPSCSPYILYLKLSRAFFPFGYI